jgi:hypothetical protein
LSLPLIPPKTEPIVDEDKFLTLNWNVFLENLAEGDAGTSWTPTFAGLTEVGGAATKTGVYYRLSKKLAYFVITITPVTNTSAVSGTTICNNFPLTIAGASASMTCSGFTAASAGITNAGIYTATWTSITSPITLTGIIRVN